MSTDGLAALAAQRDKARTSARRVPPPRHAPKAAPETAVTTTGTTPAAPRLAAEKPSPTSGGNLQVSVVPQTPTAASTEPLARSTIYVDSDADNWLEEVAILGRRGKPRTDASRSAVVRLALERMRAEMTPAEVIGELRTRAAAAPSRGGRKRL